MKKILFGISLLLLLGSSVCMLFAVTAATRMVLYLMLGGSLLLLVIQSIMKREYAYYIPAWLLVGFAHLLYVSGAGQFMIMLLGIACFLVLVALILAFRHRLPARNCLQIAVAAKAALGPELFLNLALSVATHSAAFILLSFFFLLLSSGFVWLALIQMKVSGILGRKVMWLCALLELFFGLDLICTLWLYWKLYQAKDQEVLPVKSRRAASSASSSVQAAGSSTSSARKKKNTNTFSAKSRKHQRS